MFYLLLILSFFILSCQTSEDVKIISITHSEIFNDEEEIGTPRDIMVNDSLVIVVDKYTPFIIYDRRTSEHLANKGEYGSGPLEFNRIEQLTSYKNKLYTYDIMKSMLYEVFFLSKIQFAIPYDQYGKNNCTILQQFYQTATINSFVWVYMRIIK